MTPEEKITIPYSLFATRYSLQYRNHSMSHVIPTPARIELPVRGTGDTYPVRRIYCVGRNYAAHAIEMGHDPDREDPFFFLKCPENIVIDSGAGCSFPYPPASNDVHHEIEMVVALKSGGKDIAMADALSHVYGYGVGLDMTRRDLQGAMKKAGRPWEIGKAFDHSAPMTGLVPASDIGHPDQGAVWLKVNGETRQQGDLNQLIWKVPEMISYLSGLFELAAGDLIMSGTPSGVGPVMRGDKMEGHVEGVGTLHCIVA
jgi:fumarylpyruvate hydrolase